MFERLCDAVFPSGCAGCAAPGALLCRACRPGAAAARRLIYGDLRVRAAAPYAGALRRAVLALKRGRRDAGRDLAALMAERFAASLDARAVLVPVPTFAARRRLRGFDQSVALARACGAAAQRPVLLALTQRSGDAQRGRSRSARLRARGRFACTAPELVRAAHIVLVDDVVTTGATLLDCARTLTEVGAFVGEAIVLAYA